MEGGSQNALFFAVFFAVGAGSGAGAGFELADEVGGIFIGEGGGNGVYACLGICQFIFGAADAGNDQIRNGRGSVDFSVQSKEAGGAESRFFGKGLNAVVLIQRSEHFSPQKAEFLQGLVAHRVRAPEFLR